MKTTIWIKAGLAAAILAGCAEDDVILPGKREDLRAPFGDVSDDTVRSENTAQPISLPAVTRNANWTQRIGTPSTRTSHPALAARLTGVQWSVPIGSGDSRRHRITADPVVAAGRVYTMDSRAVVSGVSTSGALSWQTDLKPSVDRENDAGGGGLAYGGGKLFASTGFGQVHAIDPSSGSVVWTQNLGAPATGAPSVKGDLVYIVSGDNVAWALNAKNGRVVWQLDGSSDNGNVSGAPAPAIGNDLVVLSFGAGEIQGAFRKGGLRRWDAVIAGQRRGIAVNTISDITGDPVIAGGTIFAGSHQGRIVALGEDNGARLWTARDGALGPVWPAGGSVFAVTDRNELVRLDAETGARIWGAKLPFFVREDRRRRVEIVAHHGPVVAGGNVIVASNDGLVRSFNPVDGTLVSTVEIPGGATTNPVIADGTLYLVSSKGQLHAIR